MKLLRPIELALGAMGEDIARIIPCGDPVLHGPDISVEEQMKGRDGHRRVIPFAGHYSMGTKRSTLMSVWTEIGFLQPADLSGRLKMRLRARAKRNTASRARAALQRYISRWRRWIWAPATR